MRSTAVASGPGWRVVDVVCSSGPADPAFEEQHDGACVAAVLEGSFQYRSARGAATLAPGALLLGNQGDSFECGHEHATGDRCLSFHFEPALLESIAAAIPGVRATLFVTPRVPAVAALAPLVAEAEAAREERDAAWLEELALRVAGAAIALVHRARPAVPADDDGRITDALRAIERDSAEPLSLSSLAHAAAMSPYHFLRTFRAHVGMTPHQYLLRTRVHRAAVRLRRTGEPVSTIAFDEGFSDLSTFNRRFRRVMGVTPTGWRAAR